MRWAEHLAKRIYMSNIEKINKPWYETIYRWGQTNLTEDDPVKCDMNFWR